MSWRAAQALKRARPPVAALHRPAGELDDPPALHHMIQEEERSGADFSATTNANLLDLESYAFTAGKCFEDSEVGLYLCAPGGGGDGLASPSEASSQDTASCVDSPVEERWLESCLKVQEQWKGTSA